VDIGRKSFIFPEVFGADAGAVTGNAVILHRWSLAEFMAGNKAALHLIRTADVTLPAGCVTLLAMIFKHCSQWRTRFHVASPGFKDGFKTAERCVKADIVCVGDVLVTGIAITLGRVDYQPHVSYLFVFISAVTAVTDNAANLAVGTLQEIGILDEDLLPYLQRR